ncbi:MAG: ferrous iron transport protein A [Myxococcales bacterium]|nr:ferrous iron transport protein A [Myxococcales bacterium]
MRTVLNNELRALSALGAGESGVIAELALTAEERAWLDAMGVSVGRAAEVLRHGVWGGPLHLRMDSGAEFALARELAERVKVRG